MFLFISIVIVLTRHAFEGFTFASSYDVVRPFFRNHVSYAAISVICLPFVWAFFKTTPSRTYGKIFIFILMVFDRDIFFLYKSGYFIRCICGNSLFYIWKPLGKTFPFSYFFYCGLFGFVLAIDNKYLDLTPNFERTITHTQFDNLIEATYKLEDISSMERVYRWMAGFEMLKTNHWWVLVQALFMKITNPIPSASLPLMFRIIRISQEFTIIFLWLLSNREYLVLSFLCFCVFYSFWWLKKHGICIKTINTMLL